MRQATCLVGYWWLEWLKRGNQKAQDQQKLLLEKKKTSLFFYFRIKVLSGRFGEGMELKPAAIVCWRLNVLLPNVHQWLAEVDPWY